MLVGEYGNAFFGDFDSEVNHFSIAEKFLYIVGESMEFLSEMTGRIPTVIYVSPYILNMLEEELVIENIKELRDKKTGVNIDVEADFNEPFFRFE